MTRPALAAIGGVILLSVQLACGEPETATGSAYTPSDSSSADSAAGAAGSRANSSGTPGAGQGASPAGAAGRSGGATPGRADTEREPSAADGGDDITTPGAGGSGEPGTIMTDGPRPLGQQSEPGYANVAPPPGEPLDGVGTSLTPPAPAGWTWYQIDGAICRDGSPTGFYVHSGAANKLVIFLEGGGACSNASFCGFNPHNVNTSLAGDGQTVINTALGAIDGRQQPGTYTEADHLGTPAGMFDTANPMNPLKDWNQVYVPYCTGDVHSGTRMNGSVPDLSGQQFVGHLNTKLFISRLVPTFKDKVNYVLLTGSSAGGFGALLNYSMVQDAFGEIPVDALSDSGPPFDDKYMPVCMQKRWREAWGLDGALPPDCEECKQADGGGLVKLANYLRRKHPAAHLGMISTMQDEVIRLFYSVGINDCATYETADPVEITVTQVLDPSVLFSADVYTMGLNDLRAQYQETGQLATFYMSGDTPNFHQHLFRPSFFDSINNSSVAAFVAGFVSGKVENVGP